MKYVLKLIGKMMMLPVILAVTLVQWFITFLVGFSSAVFYLLAGLFLMVAVLSCLMGLAARAEAAITILAGFVIFMVPIIGEWFVGIIAALNMRMRNFIRS
ncbi:MAG: hypothetical protein IKG67_01940 [Parasporobacterium sp.]|nr:hypothetical protein [Parasporobacterium sp.]